jgi:hypothetical protein
VQLGSCQPTPVMVPMANGAVGSYSLVDSKLGTALGLDTNTVPGAQASLSGQVPTPPPPPAAVNGIQNGANNTTPDNGRGNGAGAVGAGNGNNNGNNNVGGPNGNGNGIGSVGTGNGSNDGNGNTNSG